MSYFASTEPEEPIEIPGAGGKTVTFRRSASYADDLAIDIAAADAAPVAPGPNGQLTRTPEQTAAFREAYVLARTARMIVGWDLTEADGKPLPITPASLRRLTAEIGGWLTTQAFQRFQGRPEEKDRPFVKPSPEPSSAEAATTRK
jgi:hypothetical protein